MLAACGGGIPAAAATCNVIGAHKPSEAEDAFLHSDYDRAVALYQAQLQQKPNDPTLTAGLVEVLLKQQKVTEADDLVHKALAQNPQSGVLMGALGEVQYRAGTPWLALPTADAVHQARSVQPAGAAAQCQAAAAQLSLRSRGKGDNAPRTHWIRLIREFAAAGWIHSRVKERITELEAYLASANGEDPETIKSLHFYLAYLKQREIEPHKACRLVSNTDTAEIPFIYLFETPRISAPSDWT